MGGACDLYTGRLQRAKEVHGKDLFTTRVTRHPGRKISTPSSSPPRQLACRIATEALEKGKPSIVEKPMVHPIKEASPDRRWQRSKKTMQDRRPRVSSIPY